MKAFKLGLWAIVTLALLIVFVALIGQNTDTVSVTLFRFTTQEYPKWAVLVACVLIGAALSSLFFIVELMILETQNIRLRRMNKKLERAITTLQASQGSGPMASGNGTLGSSLNLGLNSEPVPGLPPAPEEDI
jgi:uncharacterized integral membrane protein